LEDLKADIRHRMGDYKQHQARTAYQDALIKDMVQQAQVRYPQILVEETLDDLVKETEERIMRESKISLEDVLRLQGQTMEWFRGQMLPRAETRLQNSLVLSEFARQEKITVQLRRIVQHFMLHAANGVEESAALDDIKMIRLGTDMAIPVLEHKTLNGWSRSPGGYVEPAAAEPVEDAPGRRWCSDWTRRLRMLPDRFVIERPEGETYEYSLRH
jgi:hypothetical protein